MAFYHLPTLSRGDRSAADHKPAEVVLQAPPVSRAELSFYIYCALSLLVTVGAFIYSAWTDKHFTEVSSACALNIAVGAIWLTSLRHRKKQQKIRVEG